MPPKPRAGEANRELESQCRWQWYPVVVHVQCECAGRAATNSLSPVLRSAQLRVWLGLGQCLGVLVVLAVVMNGCRGYLEPS